MWKIDAYLATNALHGSVYDMEDLPNVVMINDNLVLLYRSVRDEEDSRGRCSVTLLMS